MLSGAITALVTPMIDNQQVDYKALENLVELQIAGGITAVVVIGSTGEATSLDDDEKLEVINYVIKQINGRIKVIVGVGSISTKCALEFLQKLNLINGLDYILASPPPYVKPTQNGLYQHFSILAAASKAPIILYNVPGRTSCDLEDATTLKLAQDYPNIVGLKDATSNIARCSYLVKYKNPEFMLFSGDDATALAFTLSGGNGAISAVSNLVPVQYAQMINFALLGQVKQAIKLNNQILELHRLMFIETNPIPIKWALYDVGVINSPQCRLPLTTLTDANQEIIKPFIASTMHDEVNTQVSG